jgi:hypothetical protein
VDEQADHLEHRKGFCNLLLAFEAMSARPKRKDTTVRSSFFLSALVICLGFAVSRFACDELLAAMRFADVT